MTVPLPLARVIAAEVLIALVVIQVLAASGRTLRPIVWVTGGLLAVLLVLVLVSRLSTAL